MVKISITLICDDIAQCLVDASITVQASTLSGIVAEIMEVYTEFRPEFFWVLLDGELLGPKAGSRIVRKDSRISLISRPGKDDHMWAGRVQGPVD